MASTENPWRLAPYCGRPRLLLLRRSPDALRQLELSAERKIASSIAAW